MPERPTLAFALFMLIGAILYTSARPFAREQNNAPEKVDSAAKKAAAAVPPEAGSAGQVWESQCGNAPEPLRTVCSVLYDQAAVNTKDAAWREQPWVARAKAHLRQIIVAIADPGETGDTLRFDRGIEAIQSAAGTAGYSFHSYWIPWKVDGAEGSTGQGSQQDRERPAQPGLMLFRRGGDFLAVYLAGESAYSGISSLQFQNAIDYLRALSGTVQTVYIAGPNYSGSLAPLQEEIDYAKTAAAIQRFRVISPSATNWRAGTDFRREPDIQYASVVHNDLFAHTCFMDYVGRRWYLDQSRVAILSESGTVFGRGLERYRSPLPVGFPRGLSRLRNASPEGSTAALFAPAGGMAQSGKIRFTLRGPGPGRDSVPSFGSTQVPVAQETVLAGISAALRQENIEFAHILSSDIYDTIFLAGFLRRSYPDLRPYFANADLLIPRAADQMPLEGSLSVTTFPLNARNQMWSARAGSRLIMPASSRYEAGLLNAVRAVLLEQQQSSEGLVEYSFDGSGRPPLWLTVAGTNGYWPIALLDRGYPGTDDLLLTWTSRPAPSGRAWPSPGRPTRVWRITFWILVVLGFLFGSGTILVQSEWIRTRAGGRLLPALAARPKEPGALGRGYFALGQCLVTGVMLFALAAPQWLLAVRAEHSRWATFEMCASLAAFGLLIAGAAAPWVSVWKGRHHLKPDVTVVEPAAWLYAGFAGLGVLGFIAFVSIWSYACAAGSKLEGFFFCYRSLDLLNGACPSTPFLALGAGLLVLIWLHRRRQALFLQLPDALPDLGTDALAAGLKSGLDATRDPLGHPLVSGRAGGVLIACGGLITILFFPLFDGQQSLEGLEYDVLYKCTVVVFYALVVFTWARFLIAWRNARGVLDRLASHPLHSAFARLAPASTAGTILHGAGGFDSNRFVAASVNLLRVLAAAARHESTRHKLNKRLTIVEARMAECLGATSPQPAGPVGPLREAQTSLAEAGTDVVLAIEGAWKRGCAEVLVPAGSGGKPPAGPPSRFARSGEEFVALQYLGFIANVMQQLRSLLRYVIAGFFLGLVSTMLYPFRSHHAIAWAATLNFLVLGAPVAVAIAQIERHPLMRTLTRTGEHSRFAAPVGRLALYAALPALALVSSYFPALGRYLVTFLQPAMQAVR